MVKVAPVPGEEFAPAIAALAALRDEYAARYGTVIFDLVVRAASEGAPELRGEVLLPDQRDRALAAAALVLGQEVLDRVTVLLERANGPWLVAAAALVPVLASPNGEGATELTPEDPPIRALSERGDWLLVEVADGTVGWTLPTDLTPAPRSPAGVLEWRREYRGRYTYPASGWMATVTPWLGAPYRWGGSTPAGVDCSGLVQRIMKEAAGIGLPKHSADQIRSGFRVPRDELAPGDLVYMVARDSAVRHVALVLDAPAVTVVHASRSRGVTIESLDTLLERYEFKAAARYRPS